jgi:hypothetical protein
LCYSQSFPWRSNYLHSLWCFQSHSWFFSPPFFGVFFLHFLVFVPTSCFEDLKKNGKRKKKKWTNDIWKLGVDSLVLPIFHLVLLNRSPI